MKVIVPFQKNYVIPPVCCICGGPNPIQKYPIWSKEAWGGATSTRLSITFMKCQNCIDEEKTINQTGNRSMLNGLLLGGLLGLTIGVAIGFYMQKSTGNSQVVPGESIINSLIGPLCACASVPGFIGAVLGWLIAKTNWRRKLDPEKLHRLEELSTPVKIIDFSYKEGFPNIIKSGVVTLDFGNDAYGEMFMNLNGGQSG